MLVLWIICEFCSKNQRRLNLKMLTWGSKPTRNLMQQRWTCKGTWCFKEESTKNLMLQRWTYKELNPTKKHYKDEPTASSYDIAILFAFGSNAAEIIFFPERRLLCSTHPVKSVFVELNRTFCHWNFPRNLSLENDSIWSTILYKVYNEYVCAYQITQAKSR